MKKIYSHTKRSLLEKCPRQYFYQYYAATCRPPKHDPQQRLFGGCDAQHAVLVQNEVAVVGRLLKLTSAPQHAGQILHDLIAQSLRHPDWQPCWFIRKARERFGRTEHGSVVEFIENFNRLPDADQRVARARDGLNRAIETFFGQQAIRTLVDEMRSGAERLIERRISGLTAIGGFSVMGQIDFCSRVGSRVELVDWKMGRSTGDEDSLQLAVYGVWAVKHFLVEPESVRVRRVFLGDGRVEEARRLNQRRIRRAEVRLRQDAEGMAALHPYGIAGHMDAFTPKAREKVCEVCRFRTICPAPASTML